MFRLFHMSGFIVVYQNIHSLVTYTPDLVCCNKLILNTNVNALPEIWLTNANSLELPYYCVCKTDIGVVYALGVRAFIFPQNKSASDSL